MSEPTNEDIVAEAINQITARYWAGANHFAMHAWIVVGEVERLQARVTGLEDEIVALELLMQNWKKDECHE